MQTTQQQRTARSGGRGARQKGWILGMLLGLGLLGGWHAGQAADFTCPAGDVACLKAAITTANTNGEANTITLAAGTYPLTTVDNQIEGSSNGLPLITSTLTIKGADADTTIIERGGRAPYFESSMWRRPVSSR